MRDLLVESRQQYLAGQIDQAEATLRTALSENPKEARALLALGMIAVETGRPDAAVGHLEAALEIDPDYGSALCWMSFLRLQMKHIELARGFAERAVAADPRNAAAEVAFARCLVELGSLRDALPHYQRAAEIDSKDAAVVYEYADALIRASLWYHASEILTKVVRDAPHPLGLVKLAFCEHRLGRVEIAERTCRQLLKVAPQLADAHLEMARILTAQQKLVEAETHWMQAASLDPMPGFVPFEKAMSLSSIGRLDLAIEELNRSIEAKPNQGDAYLTLIYSKKVGATDRLLIERMEEMLVKRLVPESDRLNLMYALGKSYDGLGEYEKAIGYFDRANTLRVKLSGSRPFDREAFTAEIDRRIELDSAEVLRERALARNESSLPILVVGMMRSGTTLAEQVLTCHREIGGAGEVAYWGECDSVEPGGLMASSKSYVDLLTSVAPGFSRVVDKNPANIQVLGSFHLAFPNGRMIHIRRNPIDTALSIWTTPIGTSAEFLTDRKSIVFAYRELMRLADHWRRAIPEDRLLEVRYEDLVGKPEVEIRRMVEFCGVDWDEACLHPELNRRRVVTPSLWQVRRPINRLSIERWRNYEAWLGAFADLAS